MTEGDECDCPGCQHAALKELLRENTAWLRALTPRNCALAEEMLSELDAEIGD